MEFPHSSYKWRKLPGEFMTEIAERARSLRKQMGYSQKKLAELSGVSWGSVKRFETTGQISLESLLKIALILEATDGFELLFPPELTPESLDELFD